MGPKKKYADEGSRYPYNLAVDPNAQGKGPASKLMRPMLEFFYRTGHQCYLETQDPQNVPMYEHYGFEAVEIGKLPGSDIAHYAMLRKPNKLRSCTNKNI